MDRLANLADRPGGGDRGVKPVAVVGGGWAGLAAAVELTARGILVTVLEAARQLGGRARAVHWDGIAVDNGQHLFIGAYRETQRLMARVGSLQRLERRRLELSLPSFGLNLPRLPAPLHLALGLLTATGLTLAEKRAAAGFMRSLARQNYRLAGDMTVAKLLGHHGQPPRLRDRLWAPICVAALNTPLEQASAQVFCNVLRDSLGSSRAASDLLFGRGDLDALFPAPAAAYIQRHGGEVRLSCRVEAVLRREDGFYLRGPDVEAKRVILAVHPASLHRLIADLPEMAEVAAQLHGYTWQPILTTWLRFAQPVRLPFPMLALGEGQSPWVFDRGDLAPGLLAVVVSAQGPHLDLPGQALRDEFLRQLRARLGKLPALTSWKTIVERRATYSCVPDLPRPEPVTPLPGLYLAGDYTRGDYPATLEAAVASGVECARLILASERSFS